MEHHTSLAIPLMCSVCNCEILYLYHDVFRMFVWLAIHLLSVIYPLRPVLHHAMSPYLVEGNLPQICYLSWSCWKGL